MRIAVIGGDARMLVAARLFRENGLECTTALLGEGSCKLEEALSNASAAVLPYPCERNGVLNTPLEDTKIKLGDIFAAAEEKTVFIGGFGFSGERLCDYSEREDFLLLNAVATAEAAIKLALCERKGTLFGAKAAVVGYGRIGRLVTRLLLSFGANVTVLARRSESRLEAGIAGATAYPFENDSNALAEREIVFNTVPKRVITKNAFGAMQGGGIIIDLASGEGCCDRDAVDSDRVRLMPAPALPGRHFPETAGLAVYTVSRAILCERGLLI